jgi:hypothetical protein
MCFQKCALTTPELDREVVLKSVIFIVLKASEHIASAAEAGTSQAQTGEMARLWEAFIQS